MPAPYIPGMSGPPAADPRFRDAEEEEEERLRLLGQTGSMPPPPRPKPEVTPEAAQPRERKESWISEGFRTGSWGPEEGPGGILGNIREALYKAFPRLEGTLTRQKERTVGAYRPTTTSPFTEPVAPGGAGFSLANLPAAGPAPVGGAAATGYKPPKPPAATARAGAPAGAAEAPTAGGPETQVDWTQMGFGSQQEGENWARDFAAAHSGNMPWEEGTMGAEYNLQEHLAALRFGQQFQSTTGRAPTADDYRVAWFTDRFGLGPNWNIRGASRGGGMGWMPPEYMGQRRR